MFLHWMAVDSKRDKPPRLSVLSLLLLCRADVPLRESSFSSLPSVSSSLFTAGSREGTRVDWLPPGMATWSLSPDSTKPLSFLDSLLLRRLTSLLLLKTSCMVRPNKVPPRGLFRRTGRLSGGWSPRDRGSESSAASWQCLLGERSWSSFLFSPFMGVGSGSTREMASSHP